MSRRTPTLVQLTDELRDRLDRRAAHLGISRSELIRNALQAALADDREAELSLRMIDGYKRIPQSLAGDSWGDLDVWTEANTRRNTAALGEEERPG